MKNLADYIFFESLEDQPTPDQVRENQVSKNVLKAVESVQGRTGDVLRNVEVIALPGNVAGQQSANDGTIEGMKIDSALVLNSPPETLTHVLLHENVHRVHFKNNNGVRVISLAVEEALTELNAAKQNLSPPIAYLGYIEELNSMVARTLGYSVENLMKAYMDGDSVLINEFIMKARSEMKEAA